ncbi:hydantoinase/oxoprolinase family protein [Ferroplasma acidiphilum]|uniref:hydantoinase/oxoprolinase family protein n=2 Tax=Ferroplasma acidiphilum TaxID=74969 RepID=UPI0023F01C4C|nr:hydantoinase/oxoprolinase family protein [Ferroplasma acidiphilum]
MVTVSIDIGGTFTDIIVIDEEIHYYKVPTTPANPEQAVMDGLSKYLNKNIDEFVHATTIATNSLLGQYGLELPKTALLTTKGFKDVIEIGRQNRPELYNLDFQRPRSLIPSKLRYELDERTDVNGHIIKKAETSDLESIKTSMAKNNVKSLAICFLHSYLRPENEMNIKNYLSKYFDNISISYDVSPEPREYERTSTTVVNAVLMPVVSGYLKRLKSVLDKFGSPEINMMSNAGGLVSVDEVIKKPVNIIESGPAAGVIAASEFASILGIDHVISFDMGGTTSKAGTVINYNVDITAEYEVGGSSHHGRIVKGSGYPVRFPFIDLSEVSSGGGTVIWKDKTGALNIGPMSAGSEPGPVAYNRGGKEPTLTDSNLVMGIINDKMSGSDKILRKDLALKALQKLGDPYEVAESAIKLANLEMARAIRLVTVERGLDPTEFTLFGFGGAGPQVTMPVADELGIKNVIIPPEPGVFSALGLMLADIKYEARMSYPEDLKAGFNELEQRLMYQVKNPEFIKYADCRYVGQGSELTIPVEIVDRDEIIKSFTDTHNRTFGFTLDRPVEILTIRVFAIKKRVKPDIHSVKNKELAPQKRNVYINGKWENVEVYQRNALPVKKEIKGPSVIEEDGSSTFVPPGWTIFRGENDELRAVRL